MSLRAQFWIWILGGFFVGFVLPFSYQQYACNPDKGFWTIQGHASTEQNTIGRKKVESRTALDLTAKKSEKPAEQRNHAEWLCEDVKVTDLALVYFTFALVIVGWFTMRSADENTKRGTRAYLIAGPLFGVPKAEIDEYARQHRALASMFKAPWRMSIQNVGKTAAFTTSVECGLCPENEFPKDVLVSKLMTSRRYASWRAKYVRWSVKVQDIFTPTDNVPFQYRHVVVEDRAPYVGWIYFGRMTYKDVFRDEHWSTFSYKIVEDHSDAIGISLSDDHT